MFAEPLLLGIVLFNYLEERLIAFRVQIKTSVFIGLYKLTQFGDDCKRMARRAL